VRLVYPSRVASRDISMQGLVTIVGGSGFIGAQVVRALAAPGSGGGVARIRVAVRRPGRGYKLRMLGDVGQIEVVQANLRDEASIARALDGAESVINLTGILYEGGKQSFQSVHVEGPQSLAEAAAKRGIKTFVQMSALGADEHSTSSYARSKAAGEAAVRAIIPTATVVRPSIVFGQDDDFFNRFAAMAVTSPALPLIGGGQTKFQPVYVADVAAAIAQLAQGAGTGQTFELAGPATYSFKELMQLVLHVTARNRLLVPLPFPAASLIGRAGDMAAFLGIKPPITLDQVELLRTDNIVSGAFPGLADLGIQARAVEPILPTYLYRYRKGGQFAEITA